MNKKKAKAIKRWCLKRPNGKLLVRDTHRIREDAWRSMSGGEVPRRWKMKEDGWRVVKVEIKEV